MFKIKEENKMNEDLKAWAKREIELAIDDFCIDKEEGKKYYNPCYDTFCYAIDLFQHLLVPGLAKSILVDLIKHVPLTSIEDNDEDWIIVDNDHPSWTMYQCKRLESLYKKVTYNPDGKELVEYTDFDRSICIDVNKNEVYKGGIGLTVLNEMLPVTMPYQPSDKIKIFTEEFKYHDKIQGPNDTFGVLYFKLPSGEMKEVKRFFKRDHETHLTIEISSSEYLARKGKRFEEDK